METLEGFQTFPCSGVAARGASEGRAGEGVEVEVPKHRRSRWAKPGSAHANMGTLEEVRARP
jgi:hypothetical protein